MNPTPSDAGSPLATLRQLKELLDAGAITSEEFAVLKQQLLFGGAPGSLPAAGVAEGPTAPAAPHTEPVEVPYAPSVPATPAPLAPSPALTPPTPPASSYPSPYLDTPGALTPEATPLLTPEPDWEAAPPLITSQFEDNAPAEAAERRNPLNLIFAIGGLLLFLAVVGYLASTRSSAPDEHLTSTSQTAADSTAAAPEVGPQAEQLTLLPAAAPETIRVAPTVAPVPAATPLAADSAAVPLTSAPATTTPVPTVAPAPAATPRAAVPKPTATPAPADTAASRQ